MIRQSRSRNENKLNGGFVSNCYLNGIKMQGFEFESACFACIMYAI